jgi:hypothetical protein
MRFFAFEFNFIDDRVRGRSFGVRSRGTATDSVRETVFVGRGFTRVDNIDNPVYFLFVRLELSKTLAHVAPSLLISLVNVGQM